MEALPLQVGEARYDSHMDTTISECHAHVALDGIDYTLARARHGLKPDIAAVREVLRTYQQAGVDFVRDGGDAWGVSELAAKFACDFGIDYRTPLFAIYKQGCYGRIVGRSFANLDEYCALVEEAWSRGADFIKIMTTGIMDFGQFGVIVGGTGLGNDELRAMVRIAHDRGLAVMSHTNGAQAVLAAVEAGVDSIEHGNFIDGECIAALAESRTCLVPTATVARNAIGRGFGDDDVLGRIYSCSLETIAAAASAGVLLACGSDAGAVGVLHGQGVHDERSCFVEALGSEDAADAVIARGTAFVKETFRRK